MFGLGKKSSSLPEDQRLAKKQIEITQAQIDEMKRLRKKETMAQIRSQMSTVFKHITPKGIKHPDSLVRNSHLYRPTKGKHITRLY